MIKNRSRYETDTKIYHVKGVKVLVEVDEVPKTFGGLIEIDDQKHDLYQLAQMNGVIRAIGQYAWHDKGEPAAKVGDRVMFPRYSGYEINRNMIGNYIPNQPVYRIMDDYCIECVVEDKPERD